MHIRFIYYGLVNKSCLQFNDTVTVCIAASGTFQVPKNLILECRGITSAGLNAEIQELCAHVVELDLAQNGINSWPEVCIYKSGFVITRPNQSLPC